MLSILLRCAATKEEHKEDEEKKETAAPLAASEIDKLLCKQFR
jgi:hypothetical protein